MLQLNKLNTFHLIEFYEHTFFVCTGERKKNIASYLAQALWRLKIFILTKIFPLKTVKKKLKPFEGVDLAEAYVFPQWFWFFLFLRWFP